MFHLLHEHDLSADTSPSVFICEFTLIIHFNSIVFVICLLPGDSNHRVSTFSQLLSKRIVLLDFLWWSVSWKAWRRWRVFPHISRSGDFSQDSVLSSADERIVRWSVSSRVKVNRCYFYLFLTYPGSVIPVHPVLVQILVSLVFELKLLIIFIKELSEITLTGPTNEVLRQRLSLVLGVYRILLVLIGLQRTKSRAKCHIHSDVTLFRLEMFLHHIGE